MITVARFQAFAAALLALSSCDDGPPFVGQVARSQFWEYHDQTAEPLCPSLLSLLDEHATIVGGTIALDLDPSRPFRYYKFSDEKAFKSSQDADGKAFGDYLYSPRYFEAHEQAHVYTFRAWGGWSTAFLNEGEAVALSCNPTKEPDANTTPRELIGAGDWSTELGEFSFSPQAYAAAGFFVAHLSRRYGWEKVGQLHRDVPPGTGRSDFERAFARVFPVSVDDAWTEALDTPGASACDKTWTCRATPLTMGEPTQPECDGQLHRSLIVADGEAGSVLDVADGRGLTLSGHCADSGAPWYPLPGAFDGSPARHWAFMPPGTYTLFSGASDAYFNPGEPAWVSDGEFSPTAPAPTSYQLRSGIAAGTISDACGLSTSVSLAGDAITYIDLFRGFIDSWIAIDGGGGSFSVSMQNLSWPFSVTDPMDLCDGCGPDATCLPLPINSLTIGAGAFLHLRDIYVDRPPAAGQFVFRPTLPANAAH